MSNKRIFKMDFYGKTLQVEVGELAKQANGACLVRYDDTVVLSTACAGKEPKDVDFFPLTVTYEEKLYSVGKIPGGFLKREGRPSEHGTLTARMIDRPIRPLFADGFRNEVQVVNTVLSVDQEATPEMSAMLGASIALCISDIPFNGPIAGVHVGLVDGEFVVNPGPEAMEKSLINLEVAGTKDAINMVEADAKEVDEETMLSALMFGHEKIKELIAFEETIVEEVGKEKINIPLFELDADIVAEVEDIAKERMIAAVSIPGKLERYAAIDDLCAEVVEMFEDRDYEDQKAHDSTIKQVKIVLGDLERDEVRRLITEDKVRPDGRQLDEIRPLDAQVDLLPRVHGSALFTRGETQVLSACTLGALGEVQKIDGLGLEDQKRFMHHYNFPPYCVGETGRMGAPGRREIGHGALGERALRQVIPSEEEFPYAIRVVAEVLESNGSSSQASICASTMALMAAGVPISNPVAGVAMGLVKKGDDYTILTDIQGMEDHLGDMDFKVAGTKNGICALQMDIKIDGITKEILEEALAQAKGARAQIMDVMMSAIPEPRKELSPYAPKVYSMMIDPEQIRDVIGTGGKTINEIIAACDDVKIDIEQDGRVTIYHYDQEAINKAAQMIEAITKKAEVGEVYDGVAVRVEDKYAFIELFSGTNGFLHVKDVAWDRTEKVSDVIKLGDTVKVKVTQITDKGVNVSRKALLPRPVKKRPIFNKKPVKQEEAPEVKAEEKVETEE
ncbi:MAG: polyribonucleotide nucleotidyltransferase [Erysipelotrichaceae bacterium]|nr:polyribonucleotide nucleotidyltransferase [Erysipelotrichaceae bacterium]